MLTNFDSYSYNKLTLSIGLGILLGLTCGYFFPHISLTIAPIGQVFVMLLQMPVLICMFASIIVGLAVMTSSDAKQIFFHALLFLVITVLFTKLSIFIIPKALPPIKSIHHYAKLDVPMPEFSLINAFIPQNPFKSFADGATPAIVVFGLFFALALIFVNNRQVLVQNVQVIFDTSMVMVNFVSKLSFFGVFALAAVSVPKIKTMLMPELIYYYAALAFGSLFVCVILLPLFVSAFLPLSYWCLVKPLLPALLLALVSGNVLITMPFIMLALNTNIKEAGFKNPKLESIVKTLVPLSVNFPVSGKLINLLFIYFVSWYYQDTILSHEEMELSFGGFLASFATSEQSISYLIDVLKLPHDAIGIFHSSLDITSKFVAGARVLSIAALCFFTVTSFEHGLTFKPKTFITALMTCIVGFFLWFYLMGLKSMAL